MAKIFYVLWSTGGITGGQKMIVRHVETLRELGFDAHVYVTEGFPEQLEHRASVVRAAGVRAGDVVVAPDDSDQILQQCAKKAWRPVVIAQNPYQMSMFGLNGIRAVGGAHPLTFIAVSDGLGRTLKRLFPAANVELVHCFADERRFRPSTDKRHAIAFTPRKRPLEAGAIEGLFKHLHRQHDNFTWTRVENATERETAEAFAASAVFLSLNRLESVGMTTLEAMASGCICAGFLGVGGQEYATSDNGFWVPEDDCEAAADALAQACALALEDGPERHRRLEAGYETARQWTHARFRRELEETWMRIAPDTRLQTTPLDP